MKKTLNYLEIGRRIQLQRKSYNLSQSQIGKKLGVCRQEISAIENGKPCSEKRYEDIAKILHVDLGYLLYGNDDIVRNLLCRMLEKTSVLFADRSQTAQKAIKQYRAVLDEYENANLTK